MAGHLNIRGHEDLDLARLAMSVERTVNRSRGMLKTSMKWQELPKQYYEGNDTGVFWAMYKVPKDIVAGGKAAIEVHLTGATINNIYLVA